MWRVYPHLRGADLKTIKIMGYTYGVSPPAWGRLMEPNTATVTTGCIPTCVGQTVVRTFLTDLFEVYPHLRGADVLAPPGVCLFMGVSPPAWGRRVSDWHALVLWGCIPTCVGQTAVSRVGLRLETVYPHLRGADPSQSHRERSGPGVSPPAWGRLTGLCRAS